MLKQRIITIRLADLNDMHRALNTLGSYKLPARPFGIAHAKNQRIIKGELKDLSEARERLLEKYAVVKDGKVARRPKGDLMIPEFNSQENEIAYDREFKELLDEEMKLSLFELDITNLSGDDERLIPPNVWEPLLDIIEYGEEEEKPKKSNAKKKSEKSS